MCIEAQVFWEGSLVKLNSVYVNSSIIYKQKLHFIFSHLSGAFMKPQQSQPDSTVREDRIDDGSRLDSVLGVEVSQSRSL